MPSPHSSFIKRVARSTRLIRAKSPTRRVHKSIIADGNLVRGLQASGYFARIDGFPSSVVYAPLTLPTSLTPTTPNQWRDLSEGLRGLSYHAALASNPDTRGFTLRLSKAVETAARAQGKHCLSWLHDRAVLNLRRALAGFSVGPVPFWFAIEETDSGPFAYRGELHIHGEIAFAAIHEPMVRKALRVAGGDWERVGRGHAPLRFEAKPDFRWAGYCLKAVQKASPERRRLMRHWTGCEKQLAGFTGKAVTASSDLRVCASLLYSAARS
jgi:hypothetical protein